MPNILNTPSHLAGLLRSSVLDDPRLTALITSLHRDGIHVAVIRELHEWDAATATVTSWLTCAVEGDDIEGFGVARDRVSASMLAITAAVDRRVRHQARARIGA